MKKEKEINIWNQDLKNKSGGFVIPESYLENLDSLILDKISDDKVIRLKKTSIINHWFIAGISIAASLIIAFFVFTNQEKNQIDYMMASEIEWDQYASFEESWILQELDSISSEQGVDYEDDIDFLLAEGITNDEILDVFQEDKIDMNQVK